MKYLELGGLSTFKNKILTAVDNKISAIPKASDTKDGLMSATDKAKVNKMPTIKIHKWTEV